ncbi:histidine phosphatase family protein [Candidatus Parcubacteria bacterium]|nr:histidine phosphatase family protein [Candidatus Parcubacteria bacterium]
MNNLEKSKFENVVEKEKEPSKRIFFIRHPSQKWFDCLVDEATERGEDIETDLPVDRDGLKMVRFLSEYLKSELPKDLKDKEYSIYSSSIKRAKQEAGILHKNIKLSKLDEPTLPIPKNNEVENLDFFSEVPFTIDKEYARELIKKAKEKGIHPVLLWFEEKGEELLPRFQKKLEQVKKGIDFLKNQPTKLDVVVSHRLAIALTIWVSNNIEKIKDENYKLTIDDLKEIFDYSGQLPFTSITELDIMDDEIKIKKIGETPHLKGDKEREKLIKGKY